MKQRVLRRLFTAVLLLLLAAGVFAGAFLGSFSFFKEKTTDFDMTHLAVFAEGEGRYYLRQAPPDIMFYLDVVPLDISQIFTLTDGEGQAVPVEFKKVKAGQYKIQPPQGGYLPGERYTLNLYEGVAFTGEALKDARTLVFFIGREAEAVYTFSSRVKDLSATVIREGAGDTIHLPASGLGVGDIVFAMGEDEDYAIYKITELLDDDRAAVVTPALEEVYDNLQVHGTYTWSVEELVLNPGLEIEIAENVKNSSFWNALMVEAYAAEAPKDGTVNVKITPVPAEDALEISIAITLQPGKGGLFGISGLRNQEVNINLSAKVGCQFHCNMDGLANWDISADLTSQLSWTVDLGLYTDEWKKDSTLGDVFDGKNNLLDKVGYYKNVKGITDALDKLAADTAAGEIKLFDWKLPIPSVPGLYFSTEVKLFAKLDVAAEVTVGQSNATHTVVGVFFHGGRFEPYASTLKTDGAITLSLRGKAKVKAGVKLVFKATLISDKLANVNIDPQAGLYADLYVTLPILAPADVTEENFIYSYFEPGLYFSANVNATVNLLIKKFEFSTELVEKKFPVAPWVLGNKKIAREVLPNAQTVRAVNDMITLPDIMLSYYDVKAARLGSETLAPDKLKFVTTDNTPLVVEDGRAKIPAGATGSAYITATYLHTDGRTYSTVFKALLTGSMLEGKVSAYAPDTSAQPLGGAVVSLYGAANSATPLMNAATDENGMFSFAVDPGDYRLVISAEGFQSLTSSQSVQESEIKYTEHILLIDNGQVGAGSAGGRITNALNGQGLSGVTLRLRENWNNNTGPVLETFSTTTGAGGNYTVSGVLVGYYTVEASLGGYVTGYHNIIVLPENPKTDFDFTITPVLSGDEIRIVLTWDETPRDLDSHLIGKTPAGGSFNVMYSSKQYRFEGLEMANLDVDDTTSYGPETVTILQPVYGTYVYAVHDYSNRSSSGSASALSYSGAVVKVYRGSMQIGEYHVPTGQTGTYWTVFEMGSDGFPVPINTVGGTKPAAR